MVLKRTFEGGVEKELPTDNEWEKMSNKSKMSSAYSVLFHGRILAEKQSKSEGSHKKLDLL
jgi:hypothetical protein